MKKINETSLIYYLGKSPEIKVLDFLIENKRDSWNITEIEKQGVIARSTLKLVIPKLLKLNLIQVERKIGNSTLYKINLNNKVIIELIKFSSLIDKTEQIKKEEGIQDGN